MAAPPPPAAPPPTTPLSETISVDLNVLFVTASRLEWDEAILAVFTVTPLLCALVALMRWVTGRRYVPSDDLLSKTESTMALVMCAHQQSPVTACCGALTRERSRDAVICSGAWRARRPHSTPASNAAKERDRSRRCRICTPRIVPPCRASPPPPCPALNSPASPPPHSDGPPSPLQRLRPHPARRVPEPTRRRTSTTCTRIWQVSSGNCRSCAPKLPACNRSRRKAAPRRERGAASLRPIGHWARARAGHECIAEDGRVPYLLHAGRRAPTYAA